MDGVEVVRVFAVPVQPRDDAPVLKQGVQLLCQPRGIDSAHQLHLSLLFLAVPWATRIPSVSAKRIMRLLEGTKTNPQFHQKR